MTWRPVEAGPVVAMVLLTALVWARLYWQRLSQMRRERIAPQAVATTSQAAARLTDSGAADNFRNLFEVPVLFYLAMVMAMQTGATTRAFLVLAWSFVVLRLAHSVIQCGNNRVVYRFPVHVAATVVVWSMWTALGWQWLQGPGTP